jgi:hypothetical protein
VLRGWTEEGIPAAHNVQVDDVLIRNVTTDIRGGSIGRVPDGNSIFIFETGNLCIGISATSTTCWKAPTSAGSASWTS